MTFKTEMQTDLLNVGLSTDEMGETVLYKVGGAGAGTSISSMIQRDTYIDDSDDTGKYIVKESQVIISNKVTVGVVAPVNGDTVTFDTLVWYVSDVDPDGITGHRLTVRRTERKVIGQSTPNRGA